MTPILLTAHVAEILDLSDRTIYRYLVSGKIREPQTRVGPIRVWTTSEIHAAEQALKNRK